VRANISLQDRGIREVAPRILDVLAQRMSDAYMQLAEENPTNPLLSKIHILVRHAKELKVMTA